MYQNYESDIHKREADLAEYDKLANILGIFKLVWFVLSCYTFYRGWSNQFPIRLVVLLCVEVAVFIIACIWHSKTSKRISYETGLIDIAKKNLSRLSGQWNSFPDIGEEFMDYEHEYAADLDIMGNHSLFQYLNSTNTYHGRINLADNLLHPLFSPAEIELRQDAISELCNDYTWTSHMEYCFSKIGVDASFPKLLTELQNNHRFIKSKLLKFLLYISRILTCSSVLYAIMAKDEISFAAASALIACQLLIWSLGLIKTNAYLGIMRKIPYKMDRYSDVLEDMIEHNVSSVKLAEIQSVLRSAQEAMHVLAKISDNIKPCQNGIACIILNALWLWDYKNAMDLDQWKQCYSDSIELWFTTLGEFESLLSFSNLPRNCRTVCAPVIAAQTGRIHAKGMGHPLLTNEQRVCNDLDLNDNILIISGSNMSGKTTFMRTIGINMVLANAGSYVCAEQMTFSGMNIMTSMRIADELTEGISTFYAELKRIKKIIDSASADKHMFFLIDEIFRGTNSIDRLKGAEGVLRKLYASEICGIITTHDLEVCKLENAYKRIVNYSFYEHYTEGEICFDYKMQRGISKTTNAEFLLKKIGII